MAKTRPLSPDLDEGLYLDPTLVALIIEQMAQRVVDVHRENERLRDAIRAWHHATNGPVVFNNREEILAWNGRVKVVTDALRDIAKEDAGDRGDDKAELRGEG